MRQNALCLAPQSQGNSNPDYASNGGDCIDDDWHYQYIDDATNQWVDIRVNASVTLGNCMLNPTTQPSLEPTMNPSALPTGAGPGVTG